MEHDFHAYFSAYAEAYDDFDSERIAAFFYIPTLMVKAGSVTTLPTQEILNDYLTDLVG